MNKWKEDNKQLIFIKSSKFITFQLFLVIRNVFGYLHHYSTIYYKLKHVSNCVYFTVMSVYSVSIMLKNIVFNEMTTN